jgi:surface carbohydrate biosynthesis protein (TIGR04326 family)
LLESLIIWDQKGLPPEGKRALLWNGYQETHNHHSLLRYIDINSDRLRAEYLSLIYDFSQLEVCGKRIVEHLAIAPDFSLWWMNLLAEKNPVKSNTVQTTLRLMAIRDLIKELNPTRIELYSTKESVSESLIKLCDLHKISFVFYRQKTSIKNWSTERIFKQLPHVLQGFLFLVNHIFKRWTLRRIPMPEWFSDNSSVFIFSYFFNMDKKKCADGEFYSRQWEIFPEYLAKRGKKINWVHHYLSTPNEPDTSIAKRWISSFNKKKLNNAHYFLDSFLSFNGIVQILKQWFNFVVKTKKFEKNIYKSLNIFQKGWFWPIMENDWKSSAYGAVAMQNILWVNLFGRAMSKIPKQKLGLYLCENMDWERAFIYFWKKYGHGQLIAVPHSTIRYWDLRYFDDRRVWDSKDVLTQPIPDQIAVNGPLSWNTYRKANQPIDRIVKVEALRYLHLDKQKKLMPLKNEKSTIQKNKIKLLLLGDIVYESTDAMLKLLELSYDIFKEKYDLTFKPHPAASIKIEDYPNLKLTISNIELDKLFPKNQGVICSIYTSASVEAASIGLPVITILDNNELNYSALYENASISFVSTKSELERALISQYKKGNNFENNEKYFWTNPDLPLWGELLGVS